MVNISSTSLAVSSTEWERVRGSLEATDTVRGMSTQETADPSPLVVETSAVTEAAGDVDLMSTSTEID